MGIRINDLAKGNSFTVELRYGDEHYLETFDTMEEAMAIQNEVQPKLRAQAKAARLAKRAPKQPLTPAEAFINRKVFDIVKDYIETKKTKSAMKRNGKQGEGWDGHVLTIKEAIKDATVADLTPVWAEHYVAEMRGQSTCRHKPFAFSTINKHFKLINAAVVAKAWIDGVTPPRLPFDTKRLFPRNWSKSRTRTLSAHDEAALREAISKFQSPTRPQWDPLVTLALETGARLQELVLAHWDEFDLDKRVWSIPHENVKTEAARQVPLSLKATQTLRELAAKKKANSPRVFHLLGTTKSVSSQFRRSLVPNAGLTNFVFHDQRHEATTRMRSKKKSKLDSAHVAKILGHSEAVMRSTYDHTPASDLVDLLPD